MNKEQNTESLEPVGWMCSNDRLVQKGYKKFSEHCEGDWNIPLYKDPLQRKPLTKEQAQKILETAGHFWLSPETALRITRVVEAAHGICEKVQTNTN